MGITEELENLVHPTLLQNGFEVVNTQYLREEGRWVLRFFIDKLNTSTLDKRSHVSLEDCEKMSHLIELLLDGSDLLAHRYTLEVSSPGINRPLRKESDYIRFTGEKVKVTTQEPLSRESNQKHFSGVLLRCENGMIEMEDITSGPVQIPVDWISKAHLNIL